jgi:hypothetical protein
LLNLFDSIYVLALTAWVGSILFFSFGIAPLIFKVLDPQSAARFLRALFPRYYAWGAITGAIALPASVAGPLCVSELRGPGVAIRATLILACILVMFYGGNTLAPAINAARDAGEAGKAQFTRLHRLSVQLNGAVMVVGTGLLIAFAVRPTPQTQGIVELSPIERSRRDVEILKKRASDLEKRIHTQETHSPQQR